NIPVDYSIFVRENVDELRLTLFLGIVLTAAVCFLFLGSIGTTLNICLSIPTSLVGTFFVLNYGVKLFGMQPFTINLMTLLFLSLICALTLTPMLCAFFLNLHARTPTRPLPFGWPLAAVAGAGLVLLGSMLRLLALLWSGLHDWAWPLFAFVELPGAAFQETWFRWLAESAVEFGIAFLLIRWANTLYWALDRYLLEPVLIRPTEWVL